MKTFLLLLLVTFQVYAQSTATLPSTPGNTTTTTFPALSWERIKSKMRVNYFNYATGPNFKRMDNNETLDNGTQDIVPTAMYHSFNIRYNIAGNFDYFMSPRFITPMGDRKELRPGMDDNAVMADDWDFGGYYTFVNKPNFNYAHALTYRVPFSNKHRREHVDRFYVHQQLVNWAIAPAWRVLHWTQFTYYDYDNQSTSARYRLLFRNLLNYTINDKWMTQFGYEIDMQHRNPKDSADGQYREQNYLKRYHSYVTLGLGYSPVHTWTFLPYVRTLDERNVRMETTTVGFMIMGRII
jgi:hypothetical protein